jgi:nucleotide-binding universal stress UspA family protein
MPMTTILVPVDFSDGSMAALDLAADVAKARSATLHLLHAVDKVHFPKTVQTEYAAAANPTALLKRESAAAMAELERVAAPLRRRRVKLELSTPIGPAAETIVKRAKRIGADLIVMGTHGRTGLLRVLMGSVAEEVVRNATCPVTTLRLKPGRTAGKRA